MKTHDTLVSTTLPAISTFPCSVAQPPVSSSPFCVNEQVISLTLLAMSLRTFHSPVSGFSAAEVTATEAAKTAAMSAFTG